MTEASDGGVGKETKIAEQDRKLIDDYLKEVDRRLEGFTRAARDSILTEMEGHILERIKEEQDETDIARILSDLGSPEAIAEDYSPIIRTKSNKIITSQIWGVLISTVASLFAIQQLSIHSPTGLGDVTFEEYILIFTCTIGIINLVIHLLYFKQAMYNRRLGPFTFIANGYLGLVFIVMFFTGLFTVMNWFVDIDGNIIGKQLNNFEDPWNDTLWVFVLMIIGAFSFHISHLGYSTMFSDTADGIAPMRNISFVIFPVLLLVNLLCLVFLGRRILTSYDRYFEWVTPIAYLTLVSLVAMTIIISSVLILRKRYNFHLLHIDRQITTLMIVSMILIYSVGTAILFDSMALTEDSEDRRYGTDFSDFPGGWRDYYHNGSFYTIHEVENETEYRISLKRWLGNLSEWDEIGNVSMELNPQECNLIVRRPAKHGDNLHILVEISVLESPGTDLQDFLVMVLSFEGTLVSLTTFSLSDIWESFDNPIQIHNSLISLYFYHIEYNQTTYTSDFLNVSRVILKNGIVQDVDESFVSINLSEQSIPRDNRYYGPMFIGGIESFSLMLHYSQEEYIEDDTNYTIRQYRQIEFITTISSNGTILIPFTELTNTTAVPFKHREYLESTILNDYYGFNNVVHLIEYRHNHSHSTIKNFVLKVLPNGSIESFTLSERTFLEYDYWWLYYFAYGACLDANGNTHGAFLYNTDESEDISLSSVTYSFDPNGTYRGEHHTPLDNLTLFHIANDALSDDNYKDMNIDMFSFSFFFDYLRNTSILILRPSLYQSLGTDQGFGFNHLYIVEVQGENITIQEFGAEIDPPESNSIFIISIMVGIFIGGGFSMSIRQLIRRRSR